MVSTSHFNTLEPAQHTIPHIFKNHPPVDNSALALIHEEKDSTKLPRGLRNDVNLAIRGGIRENHNLWLSLRFCGCHSLSPTVLMAVMELMLLIYSFK